MSPPRKVILCWSSGKDSSWALHVLRQDPSLEVIALLTTITEDYGRVSMHGVRENLVEKQAEAAALPLWKVKIPATCTNSIYEDRMAKAMVHAREADASAIAFGDLFLQDIRDYRIEKLRGTEITPLFPLWKMPTPALAHTMINAGLKAVVTCVDTRKLKSEFSGREFSEQFLKDLPPSIDPCGENGEFHTFCYAGPMFTTAISVSIGEQLTRDNFCFTDVV